MTIASLEVGRIDPQEVRAKFTEAAAAVYRNRMNLLVIPDTVSSLKMCRTPDSVLTV